MTALSPLLSWFVVVLLLIVAVLVVDVDGVPWRCDPVTGRPCHVSAPRGSRTPGSIQGKNGAAVRAEVPRELALLVMYAAESDLGAEAMAYSGRLF